VALLAAPLHRLVPVLLVPVPVPVPVLMLILVLCQSASLTRS
jgi:hypothetical protein